MSPQPNPAASWQLKPLHCAELPPVIRVTDAPLTIGRDASNDVEIPSSVFPSVSAHHARVIVRDGELILEDLDSKNGTLVRGTPVRRYKLRHGEIFELGAGGPRFLAVSSEGLDKTTMSIPAGGTHRDPAHATQMGSRGRSIGSRTMLMIREKLGIPEETRVDTMLQKRSRRTALTLGIFAVLILAAGGGVAWALVKLGESTATWQEKLDEQRLAWDQEKTRLEKEHTAWQAQKDKLEQERGRLEESVRKLQSGEKAAVGELDTLKKQLQDTKTALERYDPINLERSKLSEVSRVEKAVVLIEVEQSLRDKKTKKLVHIQRTKDGEIDFNLEGKGRPLTRRSTGSGFCVTDKGWVITNAHVVHKKEKERTLSLGPDQDLIQELTIMVVFSGTSKRMPAVLKAWASGEKEDLALLKIKPFKDMPHLKSIDVDLPVPPRGTEVFLLGFPLGTKVMHEGEKVIASTFRGILSRYVDEYLQVDAAVHPGASGGALIDGKGRVIGVVVGLQPVDKVTGSSAIGYIIPVTKIRKIWPPSGE